MLKRSFAVLATLMAISALAGCSDDDGDTKVSDTSPTSPSASASASESTDGPGTEATGPVCTYVEEGGAAKEVDLPPDHPTVSGPVEVTIATNSGDIGATLDADTTPCTVSSFVSLANQGYFDDTICHRLTTSGILVLQCGDPSGTGMGGPGYSFADELSGAETYGAGTLAMANAGPNTNGSQFFIVYGPSQLAAAYTVFGTVDADGLEVATAIADRGTVDGGPDGPPAEEVGISTVTVD